MQTAVTLYFIGVFWVVALLLVKLVLMLIRDSWVNAFTYRKNIAKIGLYWDYKNGRLSTEETSLIKSLFITFFTEPWLSWINVFVVSIQIINLIISLPKLLISRQPQRLEELAYPLRALEDLKAESVWARLYAIGVLSGGKASLEELERDLEHVSSRIHAFDKNEALAFLRQLKVPELESILTDCESRKAM